jgi:hypothetical protein
MVTLIDENPNTQGSPGLWGFSNNQEIYYDNLTVTSNAAATAQALTK